MTNNPKFYPSFIFNMCITMRIVSWERLAAELKLTNHQGWTDIQFYKGAWGFQG